MAPHILLIEDDARLAEMVSEYLGEAGFRVSVVDKGQAGLARLTREPYDALVLDLMLPDMDGLEVCRQLRAKSDTPVLMLTARGDTMDRVVGLEMGADDYLPQALRAPRAAGTPARDPAPAPIRSGDHAPLRPARDRS